MRSPPPPDLSATDLFRLATTYLSRRAASTVQLRRYLTRKAKVSRGERSDRADERAETPQHIEDVLARVLRAGLLDDASLAQTRASALARKGFPATRVRSELKRQGFEFDSAMLGGGLGLEDEAQALRFAERKRLGPFASGRRAASFDRDVRALVRAGFSPHLALRVMTNLMRATPLVVDPSPPDG